MLESLLGNKTAERVLLYLANYGQGYAREIAATHGVSVSVVLKQLAPDGNSHICASPSGVIYCFLGGSPKS